MSLTDTQQAFNVYTCNTCDTILNPDLNKTILRPRITVRYIYSSHWAELRVAEIQVYLMSCGPIAYLTVMCD